MKEKEKQEIYGWFFKNLENEVQESCRAWAKQERWDRETWLETLMWIAGHFQDYREAEQWIRTNMLNGEST